MVPKRATLNIFICNISILFWFKLFWKLERVLGALEPFKHSQLFLVHVIMEHEISTVEPF